MHYRRALTLRAKRIEIVSRFREHIEQVLTEVNKLCIFSLREKLAELRSKGVKMEIEAVSAVSFSFLADQYIPYKIREHCYA